MKTLIHMMRQMVRQLNEKNPKARYALLVGGDDDLEEQLLEAMNDAPWGEWYEEAVIIRKFDSQEYRLIFMKGNFEKNGEIDRCKIHLDFPSPVELSNIDLPMFYNLMTDLDDAVNLELASSGEPRVEILGVRTLIPLVESSLGILETALHRLSVSADIIFSRLSLGEAHDHWSEFIPDDDDD